MVAAAGLALGTAFLNDQTMAMFGGALGCLVLLSVSFSSLEKRTMLAFKAAACFYGCALVVSSLHLVPVLFAIFDGRLHYAIDAAGLRLVDASSMVIPPDRHIAGRYLASFREQHGLTWSEGTYMGLVPLSLLMACSWVSLSGIISRKKLRIESFRVLLFSTLAAWVCLLFALGDVLMIGHDQYFSLPGRLLKHMPVLNNIRLPQRWIWPAQLCIALGGGMLLNGWLNRVKSNVWAWITVVFALLPGIEGLKYPPADPTDYLHHPYLRLPGLIKSLRTHYKQGGVLVMPLEKYYPHSNILQFEAGYDIPMTFCYTARMPYNPTDVPWHGSVWVAEAGEWLRENQVSIVAFSFEDGQAEGFRLWIEAAKKAVPGLVVLNKWGAEI